MSHRSRFARSIVGTLALSSAAFCAGEGALDSSLIYPANDTCPYHVGTPYNGEGNLLRNGDFAAGLEHWQVKVLAGAPEVTIDSSRALYGSRSLRIHLPTEKDRVEVYQEVGGLLPGTYTKKVRYQCRGGDCPHLPGRFDVTGPGGVDVLGTTPRGDMHRRPVSGPYGKIEAVWQENGWWVASDNQRLVPDSVIGRDGARISLGRENLNGAFRLGYTFGGRGTIWFDGAEVRITSNLEAAYDMGYLPALPPMDDAALFAAMDLTRPDLGAVKEAVERQDWEGARRAFLKHLRSRQRPRHFYTADRRKDFRNDYSLERVAEFARRFEQEYLPIWQDYDPAADPDFTWQFTQLRGPVGSATYGVYDQRAGRLGCVLASYFRTGEEHWLKTYRGVFEKLYRAIRPPARIPCTRYNGVDVWDPLDVAIRLDRRLEEYFLLLPGDELTLDEHAMFWKHFLEHARYVEANNRNKWGSNHQTHQVQREFVWGLLLDEFRESGTWREQGLKLITQHLMDDTLADGGHHERESGYNLSVLMNYVRTLALARANDVAVPGAFVEKLEGMFEWFMNVTLPDGALPPMGDWRVTGSGALERPEATLGAMLFPQRDDFLFLAVRDEDQRLAIAREVFPEAAAREVVRSLDARVAVAPRQLSVCLPATQWVIMRSGWTPDALALVLDYAPFVAHSHRDAQGISLWAYNKPLLMDSRSPHGSAGYQASGYGSWDIRTFAHNTLEIDDKDQPEQGGRLVQWASFGEFDFAHTVFEKYENCDHHRRILFVKPDYWIVSDAVAGTEKHTYKSYFHFVGGAFDQCPASLAARVVVPDGPGLLVASVADPRVTMESKLGFMDGAEMDTPYIWYRRDGEPSIRFDVLLAPFPNRDAESAGWTSRVCDAGVSAVIRDAEGRRDRRDVFLRSNGEAATLEAYDLQGKLALIRYAGDAAVAVLLIQGTAVGMGGDVILEARQKVSALAASVRGDVLAIEAAGDPGPVVTRLGPFERATINGRPAQVRNLEEGWEVRLAPVSDRQFGDH